MRGKLRVPCPCRCPGPCSSQQHLPAALPGDASFQRGSRLPLRRCPCGFGSKASSDTVDAAQWMQSWASSFDTSHSHSLSQKYVFCQGDFAVRWAPVPELPRCFPCCHLLSLGTWGSPKAWCRADTFICCLDKVHNVHFPTCNWKELVLCPARELLRRRCRPGQRQWRWWRTGGDQAGAGRSLWGIRVEPVRGHLSWRRRAE